LNDAGSAARLPMCEIELALHGVVQAFALADEFSDTEDGGERIIQLMRDSGKHLAHRGQLFRLDQLFFETLQIRNITPGEHNSFDLVALVIQRAEVEQDTAPVALLVTDANFHRGKTLLTAN